MPSLAFRRCTISPPLPPPLQTLQEREEEEERWQRRFKARGMPDFTSQPVFTPDKRKVPAGGGALL